MNQNEDSNRLQFLLTGIVLVVIVIGGTLAWFASNSKSNVSGISPNITAPQGSGETQTVQIEYLVNGEWDDVGSTLLYVPGKCVTFRIKTVYDDSVVKLVASGASGGSSKDLFDPKIASCMRIDTYNIAEGSSDTVKTTYTTAELNAFPLISDLPSDSTAVLPCILPGTKPSLLLNTHASAGYQYFVLYMIPSAGNDLQNLSIDFQASVE